MNNNIKAKAIWMTGLSGAGKSTLSGRLEKEFSKNGIKSMVLDGDVIRSGLSKDMGFSQEDRKENLRRVAELSKILVQCGTVVINSFITPTNEIRNMIRDIVGEENLIEVYVNSPLHVCEERDVKGLYKKARKGEIADFTGIGSRYDVPDTADIEICTDKLTVEASIASLYEQLLHYLDHK